MIATIQDVLFLKAEKKSFKKGNDTINFTQATFLDAESGVWDLTVDEKISEEVLGFANQTALDEITVDVYKTTYEGRQNVKMRLIGV